MTEDILSLARQTPLPEILPTLGIVHRHRRFDCPICGGSGRSCGYRREKPERWHCFSCGRNGSLVDIVMARMNADAIDGRVLDELREVLHAPRPELPPAREERPLFSDEAMARMWANSQYRNRLTLQWLEGVRGIWSDALRPWVADWRFRPKYRPDITAAVDAGPCAGFALRSVRGEVVNVLVRPHEPTVCGEGEKRPWKGRLLNSGPGTLERYGAPLSYGEPPGEGPLAVLVEGAIDTMTMLAIRHYIGADFTILGAYSADDIRMRWSAHLAGYERVVAPYHLDKPNPKTGKRAGGEAARALVERCPNVRAFPWAWLFRATGWTFQSFEQSGRTDINDMIRRDLEHGQPIAFPVLANLIGRALATY